MSIKHSFVIIGSLLLITSFSTVGQARADWLIDSSGTLIEVDGSILGDDDEDESSDDTRDDNEDDSIQRKAEEVRENAKDKAEAVREQAKDRLERATEARIKSQEALKQRVKSKFEIKDGSIMQIRQEVQGQDGRVVRRSEFEFKPGERLKVEREDGKLFELGADDKGRFEIMSDRFKARTEHPISIGDDNQLIITRPDGTEKVVSVLPDTAADNLIARGFALSDEEFDLELEEFDGETAYRFPVKEEKRFLGLFKRFYNQESVVSAETGEILETTSTETSPLARFLESLSF